MAAVLPINGSHRVMGGRSWSEIPGATAATLTVSPAQEGQAIQVKVAYADAKNFSEAISSASVSVPFVNDGQTSFALVGNPPIGQMLSSSRLTSDTYGDGLFSYQWQSQTTGASSWLPIAGATGASFQPTTSHQGQSLRLQVVYQDQQGFSESLTTAAVAIPAPVQAPFNGSGKAVAIFDPGGAIKPSIPIPSSSHLKVTVSGGLWY